MDLLKFVLGFFCIICSSLLAGCISKDYHPIQPEHPHMGYYERHLDYNTMLVGYSTTKRMTGKVLQTYLLFRCAEVTVENGYDSFEILSSDIPFNLVRFNMRESYNEFLTNPTQTYHPLHRLKAYDAMRYHQLTENNVRYYYYTHSFHCYDRKVTAVIRMFSGHPPRRVPHAYDARDVISYLSPDIY